MSNSNRRILLLGDARQVHLERWGRYLIEKGYDVMTASLEPVERIQGPRQRVRIPEYLPDCLRYPMAVPAIKRIIRRFDPHLVNAHFTPNYGVIAAMTGFEPWVLSTWGSDIMMLPEKSVFHAIRTRYVIKRASCITSDANVMSEKLVALGADRQRLVTVPFGVDRRVFHPNREPDVGTGRDGPRVLSNRKLERIYNIDTVVEAFSEVTRSLPAAELTIAGTGSLLGEIRRQAGREPTARSIRFAGDVAHADMPVLLRRHDIFVSVASSDTTSVSLLEAMACGVFPVVSDIPANREWIVEGQNGMLVPSRTPGALAGAIIDAWRDPELRRSAAEQNADRIAARADWYSNMKAVTERFDRLVDSIQGATHL